MSIISIIAAGGVRSFSLSYSNEQQQLQRRQTKYSLISKMAKTRLLFYLFISQGCHPESSNVNLSSAYFQLANVRISRYLMPCVPLVTDPWHLIT